MKHYLLAVLLLTGLVSCSKKSSDPAPAPTTPTLAGGTWVWTSSTYVTTPADGSAVTTQVRTVIPNTLTTVFTPDGKLTTSIDAKISPSNSSQVITGTYVFANDVLTCSFPNGTSSTVTVPVLTEHNMTEVNTVVTYLAMYVTTDTFTR